MSLLKKTFLTFTTLGLFIALFPWLFAFKGTLAGHPVSIRALGDALGTVIALAGVWMLISESFRYKVALIGLEMESLSRRQQGRVIAAATGIYAIGIISHKLRAHAMIGTHAFDLGFFSNICWNTLQGDWFYSSILERNFMGVHVNWILWPLAYAYRLYAGAQVLLVAQALFVAAAIPILWRSAQQILGSFTGGLMAAFLYAASPFLGHPVLNDFHPDTWMLPCLFLALAAWLNKKPVQLLLLAVLAVLAKEDVSVVLCGFAVFLLLQKEWRTTGAALLVVSLGIFFLHTRYFTPMFLENGQTSVLYDRYHFLGKNFQEMAANLFVNPGVYIRAFFHDPQKFWRLACYVFPVAGLPLLSPLFLIAPVISLMPHLLSQASTQLAMADIYGLPSQPFLFFGAAFGAKRLFEKFGTDRAPMLAAILFVIGGIGINKSPRAYRSDTPERLQAFRELKRTIPDTVSLAAQQNLFPQFDTRRFIQLFPIQYSMPGLQTSYLANPDFVVCDRIGNALPWNGDDLARAIGDMEKNPGYEKIFERESFLLFKKTNGAPPQWETAQKPIS